MGRKEDFKAKIAGQMSRHLGIETPDISDKIAEYLLNLAREYHILQVAKCNRPWSANDETREEKLQELIRKTAEQVGAPVRFGGDPRGYTVKLFFMDGSHNSWGGPDEGYGIPSAGDDI